MNLNFNLDSLAYIQWSIKTSKEFLYYVNLIIVPLGIVFNFLNLFVFSRKRFKNDTMGFYYTLLAILDIFVLIMLFLGFFGISIDRDFTEISNFSCKAISYFLRVFIHMSSWLNVLITVDRLVCIKYSNKKFHFLKNKSILSIIIFVLFLIFCLVNIPNLFFSLNNQSQYNESLDKNDKIFKCCGSYEISMSRDLIFNIIASFLPFVCMLGTNIWLIRILFKSRQKVNNDSSMKKDYNFAFSLIALNIFFLITLIPMAINTVLIHVFYYQNKNSPLFYGASLSIFITTYISSLNFAIPFLLHLEFNKLFKKEFKSIFFSTLKTIFESSNKSIS